MQVSISKYKADYIFFKKSQGALTVIRDPSIGVGDCGLLQAGCFLHGGLQRQDRMAGHSTHN